MSVNDHIRRLCRVGRCAWWRRAHKWRLVQRRKQVLTTFIGTELEMFVLRYECLRCAVRGVIYTADSDVLWQLDVEVPRAGEVAQ